MDLKEAFKYEHLGASYQDAYGNLLNTSHVARHVHMLGGTAEEVAVALFEQIQTLEKQVAELRNIAPVKFTLGDGTVIVWRCPDELVPHL
jgi:hypothetical protein